jgi:predicted RNase H-like HicB family nuclease
MRYPAYLEIGSKNAAWGFVFSLPGVAVRAPSAEAALAALPQAIADEFVRLERHGRPWPNAAQPVEVVESERVVSADADIARGVSRALFQYELRPTTDADVALALDRFELGRRDVLAAIDRLREAHGDDGWADVRPARPGARSAGEIATHLADAEAWLLSRLGNAPMGSFPIPPLERLAGARVATLERLTHLLPGDRERHAVFGGEPWTTRKVLRRLVCHERAHGADLEALCLHLTK